MKAFLLLGLLCLLIFLPACQSARTTHVEPKISEALTGKSVHYAITQEITLANEGSRRPEKHNIWVALIGDQSPYQQLLSREIYPDNYTILTDEYGNEYAEFDFKEIDPGTSAMIEISYQVAVNELAFDLSFCSGRLPDEYIQPELHIESRNPQIVSLAKDLSSPGQTVCEQAKSFYDYIGNNLVYSFNGENWGAQAALGEMGADCTEYSFLLIALSRAQGIPARYMEGLLYLDESNSTQARQEHAWAELYLPGNGWVPVDPTLGRSSLTRALHFARYTPNHIIVTNGRNPSTLRGASYWSHLYWPGNSTVIRIQDVGWTIEPINLAEIQ